MKYFILIIFAFSTIAIANEPKEDPNATQSPGVPFGVGPISDSFGYTVTDSSGAICSSQFIDISATGTNLGNGDDSASLPVTLATPFNLYGTAYTDLVASTNGYLTNDLAAGGGDFTNDCPLPSSPSTDGGARIYPLHDDLVVNGAMFYEFQAVCARPSDSFPSQNLGCHVFQWTDTQHFGSAGSFSFEAILYDLSWEIVFVHDANNLELGSGSTTGLQNDGATVGITYACDVANSIPASSAQCFVHPNPSASLFPAAIIPVNNKLILSLFFFMVIIGAFTFFRRQAYK